MGEKAAAGADVEEALPQAAQPACPLVEGHSVAADAPFHARGPVVPQILTHAREMVSDLDAQPLEAVTLADAGEFQQLRRGDGPGRYDHLVGGTGLALEPPDPVAHPDTPMSLEQKLLGQRIGLDAEVGTDARRFEVTARRAHAPAPADGCLRHGDPFLIRAVVIAVAPDPDARRGLKNAVVEPAAFFAVRYHDRPLPPANGSISGPVAFDTLEDWEYVLIAPAAISELCPMVVVLALAAHPNHAIDRARPAQHAPARYGDCPPTRVGFWLGGIEPIDPRPIDKTGEADRYPR